MSKWQAPKGYPNDFVLAAGAHLDLDGDTVDIPDNFINREYVEASLVRQEFTKLADETIEDNSSQPNLSPAYASQNLDEDLKSMEVDAEDFKVLADQD